MTAYAALLRGINVGGRTQIKMQALRSLFEELGFDDVTTYVQSGNVVFTAPGGSASALAARLSKAIEGEFGHDVAVLLRNRKELAEVVAKNPFLADGADESTLHVTFLAGPPAAAKLKSIDPAFGHPDEFRIRKREVYLHCPNGYGRTKLNNTLFEKRLGVAATTRNWRTVTKLLELLG